MNTDSKEFLFQTTEFAMSEYSFHFLRNRFNYKTIDSAEISEVILERGRQVNNWLIILLVGIGLVTISLYYSLKLFYYMTDDSSSGPIFIESFVIPVIPMFLGIYSLYISLKTGARLKVIFNDNKSKHFPLAKEKKDGKIDSLIQTLKSSTSFHSKFKNYL